MRCVQWDEQSRRTMQCMETARFRKKKTDDWWLDLATSAVGGLNESGFPGVVEARMRCEGPKGTEKDRKREMAVCSASLHVL